MAGKAEVLRDPLPPLPHCPHGAASEAVIGLQRISLVPARLNARPPLCGIRSIEAKKPLRSQVELGNERSLTSLGVIMKPPAGLVSRGSK